MTPQSLIPLAFLVSSLGDIESSKTFGFMSSFPFDFHHGTYYKDSVELPIVVWRLYRIWVFSNLMGFQVLGKSLIIFSPPLCVHCGKLSCLVIYLYAICCWALKLDRFFFLALILATFCLAAWFHKFGHRICMQFNNYVDMDLITKDANGWICLWRTLQRMLLIMIAN